MCNFLDTACCCSARVGLSDVSPSEPSKVNTLHYILKFILCLAFIHNKIQPISKLYMYIVN